MTRLRSAVVFIVVLMASLAACGAWAEPPAAERSGSGSIEVAFTPRDRIDRLIVGEIDRARHDVTVNAFSFTDRSIARALVRARQRGVQVRVLADREQARALPQSVFADLVAGGVEVWLDSNFQAAHNKVIVVDAELPRATTITGSYNFTIAAQRSNAENVIVLRENPAIARAYLDNWSRLQAKATPWGEIVRP